MVGFEGGANWIVAQGPPQLRGLYKNSKNYYLKKQKKLFETDYLE